MNCPVGVALAGRDQDRWPRRMTGYSFPRPNLRDAQTQQGKESQTSPPVGTCPHRHLRTKTLSAVYDQDMDQRGHQGNNIRVNTCEPHRTVV